LKPIPVNTPLIEASDRAALLECVEAGWISSEGPQVSGLEGLMAEAFGREYAIAVSSGTAALDIAVRALDLRPGDEVLVPSMTIISCAQAIVNSGAKPVPVECDATDWNAHLPHFQACLTPRTRAIMLVHLYGLCADLDPLLSWARENNLRVVEDASQVHGVHYRGRPCGSFGDVSILSLYANKTITTGEGGMILCDLPALEKRCRSLRNLCFDPARRFWHTELGWNYRMTAMQAALGIPQVGRLSQLAERKRRIGRAYESAFRGFSQITMAPVATPYVENGYWVFALVVSPSAGFTRDELMTALAQDGIGTRTFFYGLHQQPVLLERQLVDPVSLPVTESLAARGMYLPSGLGLTDEDQGRVIDKVCSFLQSAR
jgi:perosamine synthetase